MKASGVRAPTLVETLRMCLTQAESAIATGDGTLLARSIDAFGPMLGGLRLQATDLGASPSASPAPSALALVPSLPTVILADDSPPARATLPALPPAYGATCDARPVRGDIGLACQPSTPWRGAYRRWRCSPTLGRSLSGGRLCWLVVRAFGLTIAALVVWLKRKVGS